MNDSPLRFVPAAPTVTSLRPIKQNSRILVVRTPSGLSGDMLVTGLASLLEMEPAGLNDVVESLAMPELRGTLSIHPHAVNEISGWQARVLLPQEHSHRTLTDILGRLEASRLTTGARELASRTFRILAEAEARVHGIAPENVSFHEVGALDSILDIAVAAALYDRLKPETFHCSALPICDGVIRCEHGLIASPAPAVQEMLAGVPVYGVDSRGETVTPTALAFLLGARVRFGSWPTLTIERVARVYGGRILPGVPNGAIFTVGHSTVASSTS